MLPILLTALASVVATPSSTAAVAPQDPAIRVWISPRDYVERGQKVRAYLRTGLDGYVVILNAEPSGRVRVLFPLDPEDDAYVRAGQDYEIRSRSDKEAFRIYDGTGTGVIVAAISRDPLRFSDLSLNRHWDYRAVAFGVGNDAEADLLAVVQQMTGGAWFDYDVVRYDILDPYAATANTAYALSFYGPYVGGHYWTGGIGFSIGFNVGWGWGWYDPWYWPGYWGSCCYSGWYYPAPYRYAYYPYYPYYPSYPVYPGWGYPPGYWAPGGPTYARHFYASGSYATNYYYARSGAWGSYAFKSYDDRYGLSGGAVTARRRTVGTGNSYVSAGRTAPATTARRRTSNASTPVAASTPRRGTGTLEARRPSGTSGGAATVLPAINGRRRAADAAARTPPSAGERTGTAGNRRVIPSTGTPMTGQVTRGRTTTPTATGTPRAGTDGARRTTSGTATRSSGGIRQITPRRIDEVGRSSAGGARPSQGRVGSGSTSRPSGGALERRTPTRTVSPPSSRPRTVSPPTRSAPTRSAPRSAPRATPSRPPSTSRAPTRSTSRPPARTSRPPARTSRPPTPPTRRR